jgi:hypothetical protein|tara:strand:+ start:153 stop:380 length:228 start_codon:yes stop_codon:yes gene_type:complete
VGRINIHRTYIPESYLGPGVLVHTTFEYKKEIPHILALQVYVVDNETVGNEISEELDIFCHLYLTKLVTEELSLL